MRLKSNLFATKQIDAPEAVLREADDRQSRRTAVAARTWMVVLFELAAHDILVDRYTEGIGDLLRDPRAAETPVAPFQLHDDPDQLLGRTSRSGLRPITGCIEQRQFALDEHRVESE